MRHTSLSSNLRRRRLFSLALLGCACATLPARQGRAQTASSAPVASNGVNVIETGGVYPAGTAGSDHYLDIGAAGSFPSFAVLDFSVGSFALTAPVTSVSALTLSVTEANYSGSKAGTFAIYLTEDTNPIATANNGAALKYDTTQAPGGLGTQLGDPNAASPTLFQIGSFTSSASTTSTTQDTFTLTLTSAAQAYFDQQLNAGASGDLRLVIASTNAGGYATFLGNTSAVPAASEPTLAFSATLNQPSLAWTPGGSANNNGGPGTWLPAGTAGDTSWNGGAWNNSYTAVFGGTGGAVTIGSGGVSAQGIQFNTTGYTLGTTGGPAITLTSGGVVQVTTAGNTDTINAPIAGAVGLNKTGAGTLVLGGTNTYSGTTTITAGTLQVSSDAAFGAAGNNVALAGGTLASGVTAAGGTLALTRGITGSGSVSVAAGTALSTSGVVNVGAVNLTGGGTVLLTNTGSNTTDGASHAFTSLGFMTGGAALQTQNAGTGNGLGIVDINGLSATQTSGTATVGANVFVAGTVGVAVGAGATLNVTGGIANSSAVTTGAVLAKTGAGTLVLGGDNSGLTGNGTASFRQGTAGNSPVSGGIISIAAGNPNPGAALGTSQFQANGGTVSNDTGTPITLQVSSISSGGQVSVPTTFAGNGSITVPGNVSLYKASTTTTSYQHAIVANTPTIFTGLFTVSTGTGNSTGLTLSGSSTLTLGGTAGANTFTEAVSIATTGAGGVILGKDGAFGANTAITINSGATLSINTGVTTGTVDAVNNAALLSFQASANVFGKLALTLGTATETVGGLYLAAGDGVLQAGYQKPGTYGPTGSGATYVDNNLFSGTGVINNLGTATAVPEPSMWALVTLGSAVAGWLTRRFR